MAPSPPSARSSVQRVGGDPRDRPAKLRIRRDVRAQHPREATIDTPVGSLRAEGRSHTRARWHEDALEPDPARERGGVERACAAERHQVEAAVVEAAVGAQQPDRVRHVLARDIDDRVRGRLDLAPELGRDPAHRPTGEFRVERNGAAEEVVGIETSEHEICVRDRGRGACPSRRRPAQDRRPRSSGRPSAALPGSKPATELPPAPIVVRSTTGTAIGRPHSSSNWVAAADRAVDDDADVGARAAHVEGDHVRAPGCLGEVLARDQAARQAGDHEADRLTGRLRQRVSDRRWT